MLNKQLILNVASRFLKPEKAQMLSRAYDVATNILQGSNNPQEVFQKAGIDRASFEKAKSLLNHPLAGWAIQKLACDILTDVDAPKNATKKTYIAKHY